jgi:glutamate racemase
MPTPSAPARVAVFDSGVGGLGVLRALRAARPDADVVYVADSAWAPYGALDDATLVERSSRLARHLREHQRADLLVIACNTATAAAIDRLRADHPGWPIVGIEPAIKPAAALTRSGHVGVLATEATLRNARIERLVREHGEGVTIHRQPCPGLADAIERGDHDAVRDLAQRGAAPLREAGCDIVVLGCTHYPFAAPQVAAALGPGVTLVDPAEAVARRAASLLGAHDRGRRGRIELWATGETDALAAFARRHLDLDAPVRTLAF